MSSGKRVRVWAYLGSGLLIWLGVVALAFVVAEFVGSDEGVAVASINTRAPDFELENLNGERIRLSQLRGKPVVLNFWATWCAPCVIEMPIIQRSYEKYPGQFHVLAINADEPHLKVERFVEDIGLTFEVLLDPGGAIQELYQIRGYPTSYFVDAEGIIRNTHIGTLTADQLSDYLIEFGVGE